MIPKSPRRLLLCAFVVALAWTTASTGLSASGPRGVHLTRNGFRTPLYGVTQVHDASGAARTVCAALTPVQVEAARFGRRVSRTMVASSPHAVVTGPDGGATFEIAYTDAEGTGFNDSAAGETRRRALQAALQAWSLVLRASHPIKVEAAMGEIEDGDDDPNTLILATAGPTDFWVIDGKGVPSSLAWQILEGRQSNAGDSDITINANIHADWDYAVNGAAAPGKSSFVYTLMHEIAHGLGFIDSFDIETGKLLNDPLPFIFDVFVNRGSGQRNRVMDHAADEAKGDMQSGDLFFNGENGTEASRRSIRPLPMIKLYAPDPYEPGSSVGHVDQETYADIRTGLMTPIDFGPGTDRVDTLTIGIMKDLGYSIVPNPVTTRTRQ